MVYILDGGPRGGQIVDDLPAGYSPLRNTRSTTIELFDGFEADRARWVASEAATTRWRL